MLGIDAGERRIGLALSDEMQLLASPHAILDRSRGLTAVLDQLLSLVRGEHVERVVVGLPLNADGSEGPQARRARAFAATAERVLQVPVTVWDERLTSQEATAIGRANHRSPRDPVDDIAASLILQDYLDAQRRQAGSAC